MIRFATSAEDFDLIETIATRAVELVASTPIEGYNKQTAMMDISAVHVNGCPLKLKDLAEADDYNFGHDIFGIIRHLDRRTGHLENCFVPRFAQSQ